MVSAFGYYASSKGMVLVPNLSGLTRTAAIAAIQNANLTPVDGGIVETTNSGLDDFIASQNPASGTLVDYQTNVQYTYYDFTSPPPFFPFFPPSFPFFPFFPPSFPSFPTFTTTYWYTGCCSTTGQQVTGTSTTGFPEAFNAMNAQCSGTVINQQSGVDGTIPTLSCTVCSGTCTAGTVGNTTNCDAATGSCTPSGCATGCPVTCTNYCSTAATSPGQSITASGPCGSYTITATFPGARAVIRCCSC
jgi:hypothetical protein